MTTTTADANARVAFTGREAGERNTIHLSVNWVVLESCRTVEDLVRFVAALHDR